MDKGRMCFRFEISDQSFNIFSAFFLFNCPFTRIGLSGRFKWLIPDECPWSAFAGIGNFIIMMPLESFFKIGCIANIVPINLLTINDISVIHSRGEKI